jgi:hypothetical protein
MKKLFLAVAVLAASLSASAQIIKQADEVCNYLDIQAEKATLTTVVPSSTVSVTSANGTKFWGYANSLGEEATISWNTKDSYNTAMPMPELVGTIDSLKVGTMFRAASGAHIDLGAFQTSTDGKITVYFQPNGDSDRGLTISVNGTVVATKTGSGVKLGGIRPAYAAEYVLPAGTYPEGSVVITVITNTSNIFGINIEKLTAASSDAISSSLLKKVADELVNPTNLEVEVYSVSGVKVLTSSEASISISGLANGAYIAKTAEGTLKFVK